MAASLFRNRAAIHRLLKNPSSSSFNSFRNTPRTSVYNHNNCNCQRPYLNYHNGYSGVSNFVKNSKKFNLSTLRAFCSSSSSSAAATAATPVWLRSGFVGWYLGMVKSRPILTKSITCSLIYVAADLSSQTIVLSSNESYDFLRTMRMGGYGLIILGPTLHFWFNFMSKILPGRDIFTTVKKMALGQSVYGPIMTVIFFSMNAALQGEDGREIIARLKRDLLPTLLSGVMYWPACDFITFKFVPVHLQPLVSNSFSYLWTVYLTYMASLDKASTE